LWERVRVRGAAQPQQHGLRPPLSHKGKGEQVQKANISDILITISVSFTNTKIGVRFFSAGAIINRP
jgi:hypothetical protein